MSGWHTTFSQPNTASLKYVQALESAYLRRTWIPERDFATLQDDEILDKVLVDPVIRKALTYRKHLVAGRDWFFEPGADDLAAKLAAKAAEALFRKIAKFAEARFLLSDSIFRGRSHAFIHGHEIELDALGDGRRATWWAPIRLQDIDKFRFRRAPDDPGRSVTSHWQLRSLTRHEWERVEHPEWFVWHLYDDAERNMGYGRGLLEALYFFWYFKSVAMKEGMHGLERWSSGIVVASIDSSMAASHTNDTATQRENMERELHKQRSRHEFIKDKADTIEVLTGGMEGHQIVMDVVNYCDNAIVGLLLGSVMPTGGGSGDVGSFARAKVEESSTEALVQFDRTILEETITRDVLGLTWAINKPTLQALGLGDAPMPAFRLLQEQRDDPNKTAQIIQTALASGIPLKREEVYARLGFSPPSEGDAVIEPRPAQAPALPSEVMP